MFIDEIKVYARAGHGGPGCVAFLREAYRPKGGPSGGNGGRGGTVILQADHDLNNLIQQYYVPRLLAECGTTGMGKGMDGPAGKDLIIKVPCGTLVWRLTPKVVPGLTVLEDGETLEDDESTEEQKADDKTHLPISTGKRPVIRHSGNVRAVEMNLEEEPDDSNSGTRDERKGELIADLTHDGQQFVLCQGGRGGLGNRNFANSRRQSPRFAQPGEPADEGDFLLELRMMAEVGLVGYPNAGKSTLLTAISHARPKIAPYPFTTRTPQVGIVEYSEDFRRLVVCDVPGLIEGAHRNVGLGHAFLRHIKRCKIIVVVLDMAGVDAREPWDDYHTLLKELELFDAAMLKKPLYVVANKMDEPAAEANLKQFKKKIRKTPVLPIAAGFGQGIDAFKALIREAVEAADAKS